MMFSWVGILMLIEYIVKDVRKEMSMKTVNSKLQFSDHLRQELALVT